MEEKRPPIDEIIRPFIEIVLYPYKAKLIDFGIYKETILRQYGPQEFVKEFVRVQSIEEIVPFSYLQVPMTIETEDKILEIGARIYVHSDLSFEIRDVRIISVTDKERTITDEEARRDEARIVKRVKKFIEKWLPIIYGILDLISKLLERVKLIGLGGEY